MGNSLKVALALGVGYFLGRTHKTRLAILLAAGAATGGFGGVAGRVLTSGGRRLAASETLGKLSPDFGNVVDSVKGDLAEAGKAAAMAAISNRLDAVAESIHDRTEAMRGQAIPHGADSEASDISAEGERGGYRSEPDRPERREEGRRRPEGGRSSDQDRPQRPPRQRPSGEPSAARPRSSARDRHSESSRAGRSAPRGGGD